MTRHTRQVPGVLPIRQTRPQGIARTQNRQPVDLNTFENDLFALGIDIRSNTARRIPAMQANETATAPKPLDEREMEASNLLKFFQNSDLFKF